jgi:UDP-2,4-diacetamido-2,4,6-trideoxy-beta-L-altropyranose hydrolase
MVIFIRVDASTAIGTGHVQRCLTLADTLHKEGATISFICRELSGSCCSIVEEKGYKVYRLPFTEPTSNVGSQSSQHAHWLGVDWEIDAEQTKSVLLEQGQELDLLIIDHYALDERWEKYMRPYVDKIMVIDDLADRAHDCDLLLDQNLYENAESRYKGLIPDSCRTLLGPKYALLRPEFKEARRDIRVRSGDIERILIFFGGGDPTNETTKALEAMRLLGRPDIAVDVIVGSASLYQEQIKQRCASMPNTMFYYRVDNMARLMDASDLAIGAGGTTTWERCCLGLPALVSAIALNQEAIAEAADKSGACLYLGVSNDLSPQQIKEAIEYLLEHPDVMINLSKHAAGLVDGLGVTRVVKELISVSYKITIISDAQTWVNSNIPALVDTLEVNGHEVKWVHKAEEVPDGDFVFYLGCSQLVPPAILSRNRHNLVIHESALPLGKGWSPLTWQILADADEIQITLFEAAAEVDSGVIYLRDSMRFQGTELVDELRQIQAETSIKMCLEFVEGYPDIIAHGVEQLGESTFYPRRGPQDSRLDPDKSIREQFNLMRVVDNERYPAFFEIEGTRYILKIEKASD